MNMLKRASALILCLILLGSSSALAAKKEESHPDVERLSLFDEEGEKE